MEWNVLLRSVRRTDKDPLFRWINDREVVLYNAPWLPVGEAEHEQWFESVLAGRDDAFFFMIEEKESGRAIGSCQLVNISWIHRNAEIRIRIGEPSFWGKGFGSEAVRLLAAFGFRDLNLHRIFLHVFASNARAIRSYEKCGFEHEGTLREAAHIDGTYVDVHVMSILRKETGWQT